MKRIIIALAGELTLLALVGGCVTTTVDKGPPKIGQTVRRPHPAQDAQAQETANQAQQDATASRINIPGDNAPHTVTNDSSVFSGNGPVNAGYQSPANGQNRAQQPAQSQNAPMGPANNQQNAHPPFHIGGGGAY